MEVGGVLQAPAALLAGKETTVPLNRWLGGPESPCGRFWRREEYAAPARNRTTILEFSSPSLHYGENYVMRSLTICTPHPILFV